MKVCFRMMKIKQKKKRTLNHVSTRIVNEQDAFFFVLHMSSFIGLSDTLLSDIWPSPQLVEDAQIAAKMILLGTNSWEFHERVWKRLHWELRIFHRCKFKGYTCTSAAEKELLAEIQKPADEIRSSFADQIRGRAGHYLSFKVNRLKEFLQLLMQNSTRYSEWENDITCILLDINSMKSNCY